MILVVFDPDSLTGDYSTAPRAVYRIGVETVEDAVLLRSVNSVTDATESSKSTPVIRFLKLDTAAASPRRAHRGDAGVDLAALTRCVIEPGERVLVGTGIAIALPLGYVGLIHPRSGLALRSGLSIVNTPGTIDADYRGEIKVCLINLDPREPVVIEPGDRIAQLLIQRVELCDFEETDALDETVRGASGYGSTGVN